MTTSKKGVGVVRRKVDPRKLHKELGDISDLRIYQVRYYPDRKQARCIACATTPKTPKARMKDNGVNTNGRPIMNAYWVIDLKTNKILGPCGSECGSRAVMNSWLKPRREAIKDQLLAKGVPANEIDERLEQLAHYEWLKMLRVYKKAEKEAAKLGINTTTMTFDQVIEAVVAEKERLAFEESLEEAKEEGLLVDPTKFPPLIDNIPCSTSDQVRLQIARHQDLKVKVAAEEAKKRIAAARKSNQDHVEFIEWALETTDIGKPNASQLQHTARRNLERTEFYINRGTPYARTLSAVEVMAGEARSWPHPWAGKLGPVFQAPAAGGKKPVCPKCMKDTLVRRSGYSKHAKRNYDFYGCREYPNCKGSMEVAEYEKQMGINQPLASPTPTSTPQPAVPKSIPPKALLAAKRQHENLASKPTEHRAPEPLPVPEPVEKSVQAAAEERKKRGYWS